MPIFCSQYTTSHPTRWTRRQLQDAYELMLSICIDYVSQICIVGNYIILYLCICICIDSIDMFPPNFPRFPIFLSIQGVLYICIEREGKLRTSPQKCPVLKQSAGRRIPAPRAAPMSRGEHLIQGEKRQGVPSDGFQMGFHGYLMGISWDFNIFEHFFETVYLLVIYQQPCGHQVTTCYCWLVVFMNPKYEFSLLFLKVVLLLS